MARGDGRAARRRRELRQARGLAGRDRPAAVAVGRAAPGRARRGPEAPVAGRHPASMVRDCRGAGLRDGLAAGCAPGAQTAACPDAPRARVRRRGPGQAGRSAEERGVERVRPRAGARAPGPHPQGPLRSRRSRDRSGGCTTPVACDRSLWQGLRRGPVALLVGHQRRGPAGSRGSPCRQARCERRVPEAGRGDPRSGSASGCGLRRLLQPGHHRRGAAGPGRSRGSRAVAGPIRPAPQGQRLRAGCHLAAVHGDLVSRSRDGAGPADRQCPARRRDGAPGGRGQDVPG